MSDTCNLVLLSTRAKHEKTPPTTRPLESPAGSRISAAEGRWKPCRLSTPIRLTPPSAGAAAQTPTGGSQEQFRNVLIVARGRVRPRRTTREPAHATRSSMGNDGRGTCTPKPASRELAKGVRPPTRVCPLRGPRRVRLPPHPLGCVLCSVLSCSTCDRPVTSTLVYHENGVVFAPHSSRESPGMKPPKGGEGRSLWEYRPPPRDQPPRGDGFFIWSRGLKSSGLASFTRVAAPPGRSEQNRLSPPPRVIFDAGISPFWG